LVEVKIFIDEQTLLFHEREPLAAAVDCNAIGFTPLLPGQLALSNPFSVDVKTDRRTLLS